jgi:hypothetical protein
MQLLLVDAPEGTEVRAERRASACTGVAVDLAEAVPICIPGPLMYTVADADMGRMTPPIALPLVGIEGVLPMDTFSAINTAHVRVLAWSPTQKRCSPVSRETILIMGGRALA